MENENNELIQGLTSEVNELRGKNAHMAMGLSNTSYQGAEESNIIHFQLDTGDMLEKLEHFFRGDKIEVNKDTGEQYWARQKNKDLILFNEYGINSLISIIGNYLDKNTILSHYDEMRINEILADLGDELAVFIYCNYDMMGMDTNFKKTRFQLTVINILHSIESAYRRALRGRTREDLNSSRIVTQSEPIGMRQVAPTKQSFSILKPKTW